MSTDAETIPKSENYISSSCEHRLICAKSILFCNRVCKYIELMQTKYSLNRLEPSDVCFTRFSYSPSHYWPDTVVYCSHLQFRLVQLVLEVTCTELCNSALGIARLWDTAVHQMALPRHSGTEKSLLCFLHSYCHQPITHLSCHDLLAGKQLLPIVTKLLATACWGSLHLLVLAAAWHSLCGLHDSFPTSPK